MCRPHHLLHPAQPQKIMPPRSYLPCLMHRYHLHLPRLWATGTHLMGRAHASQSPRAVWPPAPLTPPRPAPPPPRNGLANPLRTPTRLHALPRVALPPRPIRLPPTFPRFIRPLSPLIRQPAHLSRITRLPVLSRTPRHPLRFPCPPLLLLHVYHAMHCLFLLHTTHTK